MNRVLLALLLTVGLPGCRERSSTDTQAVRQIIDEHNAELERWYAAGQIDSVANRFTEDVWQLPPNRPPLIGRDSLRQFWTKAVGWGKWEFDFAVQDVIARDSLAVERGRYTLKFTAGPQAPMPSLTDEGNYVVLWRQDPDGQWRIVWDAPVSVRPPGGPPNS